MVSLMNRSPAEKAGIALVVVIVIALLAYGGYKLYKAYQKKHHVPKLVGATDSNLESKMNALSPQTKKVGGSSYHYDSDSDSDSYYE